MLKIIKRFLGIRENNVLQSPELIDAVIIDVRTDAEFNSGHLKDAINLPLDRVSQQIHMIKKLKKPLLIVCQSGNRSRMAVNLLNQSGIRAIDGGSWKQYISNKGSMPAMQ